jgi:hypothetical protein
MVTLELCLMVVALGRDESRQRRCYAAKLAIATRTSGHVRLHAAIKGHSGQQTRPDASTAIL